MVCTFYDFAPFPNGILTTAWFQWDFSHGSSGISPTGTSACFPPSRATHHMLGVLVFPPSNRTWTTGYLTCAQMFLISPHLPLNREGRWNTTDDFTSSFLQFSVLLYWPLGLCKLLACPFPFVFPPLVTHALSSSLFYCALQDDFGQT